MGTTSTHRSETVIRRLWTPDPGGLLELWQHEGARTRRTFGVFAESDLAFRPQAGARSVAELMQHLVQSYRVTHHWLVFESAAGLPQVNLPTSVADATDLLKTAQRELFRALAETSPESFRVEIVPFGAREARGVMAIGMLKHEIHHRGELYALARVCGRTPPHLYEAVRDE